MPRKRRKRRRAWGSITEVDPGRRYVLRWVENTPEGRKRRSRTFRGTYREADLELSRLQVEHADSGDRPVPTIGKIHDMWFDPWMRRRVEEGSAKENTLRSYDRSWNKVVSPKWARVPIDSISPAAVQEWLLGLTAGNAKIAINVLRMIGDLAVRYEVVSSNKFRLRYEMSSRKAVARNTDVYTLAQADELFHSLRDDLVEPAFILACFGSARTGEAAGVRACEVGEIVRHGVIMASVPILRRMEQTGVLPMSDHDLKNRQSERTLAIPEPYGTRLLEIAAGRMADGCEWLVDRGDGLPPNKGILMGMWERGAGPDAIPFGNLRPSWRTFAQYEWGVDFDTLELLMGHKIQGVTGRHYLRPSFEALADSMAAAIARFRAT